MSLSTFFCGEKDLLTRTIEKIIFLSSAIVSKICCKGTTIIWNKQGFDGKNQIYLKKSCES